MERQAEARVQHPRCPFCRDGVAPRQAKAACDACMTWHHAECWSEHGGCSACQSPSPVGAGAPEPDLAALEPAPPEPAREAPPEQAMRFTRGPRRPLTRLRRLARPASVSIKADDSALRISHRWGTSMGLILLGPALLLLVIGSSLALGPELAVATLVASSPLFYGLLAWGLETTTITVTKGQLDIDHGPLPWPGSGRSLRSDQLEQLYCREGPTRDDSFHLEAILRGGRHVPLVRGGRQLVTFLEREIESWLGIVDRPVPGEIE